ncbi:hypothetical protein [Streptomyces coelicoflavus]
MRADLGSFAGLAHPTERADDVVRRYLGAYGESAGLLRCLGR